MNRNLDDALMRLDRAIRTALDQGRPVPCLGRDEWTSDADETQRVAAIRCRPCTVLEACADAIQATPNGQRWGVWAGQVHRPPWLKREQASA